MASGSDVVKMAGSGFTFTVAEEKALLLSTEVAVTVAARAEETLAGAS